MTTHKVRRKLDLAIIGSTLSRWHEARANGPYDNLDRELYGDPFADRSQSEVPIRSTGSWLGHEFEPYVVGNAVASGKFDVVYLTSGLKKFFKEHDIAYEDVGPLESRMLAVDVDYIVFDKSYKKKLSTFDLASYNEIISGCNYKHKNEPQECKPSVDAVLLHRDTNTMLVIEIKVSGHLDSGKRWAECKEWIETAILTQEQFPNCKVEMLLVYGNRNKTVTIRRDGHYCLDARQFFDRFEIEATLLKKLCEAVDDVSTIVDDVSTKCRAFIR